jgi:hypothetical protein
MRTTHRRYMAQSFLSYAFVKTGALATESFCNHN